MRDKYKSYEYFSQLQEEDDKRTSQIRHDLKEYQNKGVSFNEIAFNIELYSNIFNLIPIKYSRGDKVSELVSIYQEIVPHFLGTFYEDEDYSKGGDADYAEVIDIISVGILLNADIELKKLSNRLQEVNYKDRLVSLFLQDYGFPKVDSLIWPKFNNYKFLEEPTNPSKERVEEEINFFLEEKFYTRKNLGDYYNAHKREDDSYIGYWSWETGAIVKLMSLDDSNFKDNLYYPYDMVHWQD